MKRVSIVIVTYNSEKDIYDCLESIFSHSDIPEEELEIIIVENNSPQGNDMLRKLEEIYGNRLILIRNTVNGGYGQGNNVGIRQASAPVIMIMNPDVRLYEPVFSTVLQEFERDNQLSICGMKQMYSPQQPSTNSFTCTYMMNGYLRILLSANCSKLELFLPRWMYFSGSCFFIRKDMFQSVGLFDEENFMYGEEDDIHYRIQQRYGSRMRYFPQLHYIHLADNREPDINYEMKKVQVAETLNAKKGWSREKTHRTFRQMTRLQILIERLRNGKGTAQYKLLKDLLSKLSTM